MKTQTTRSTDLESLLKGLDFTADNVVDAATRNAVMFMRAVEYRIRCMHGRVEAKMRLESSCAAMDAELRKEARDLGEKITEKGIEQRLTLDKLISERKDKFSEAEELEEYAKLLVEAYRMRRDCLKIVGDLTRDELSLQRSVEVGKDAMREARGKMGKRYSD